MTYKVFKNAVSRSQRQDFLSYFDNDTYRHKGCPYLSIRPPVEADDYPKQQIISVLDSVLDERYEIEEINFFETLDPFRLHVDTGNGDQSKLYKNICIPLEWQGINATCIFKNRWIYPRAKFRKDSNFDPLKYTMYDRIRKVEVDIKNLHHLQLSQYDLTRQERSNLVDFMTNDYAITETDYTKISDYKPGAKIDEKIYTQYLSHIFKENFEGLTIETIYDWQQGDVLTFDRQHLHCGAGDRKYPKRALIIFTNRL